jgi:predicted O-methyltransferase YrrM
MGVYGRLKSQLYTRYYDLSHLSLFQSQETRGPILKDEALFLYALVKMIRPKVIVEFGFSRGHSSLNFLSAMDRDSVLYSYDISESAKEIAVNVFKKFRNFNFLFKSQLDFLPSDIGNKKIDLIYMDAVYETEVNMQTFDKFKSSLSDHGIIALHDTGTWHRKCMDESHLAYASKKPQNWLNENEFQQQKGQREFCNAFMIRNPEFGIIHFHSHHVIRCGITLLQKRTPLQTG